MSIILLSDAERIQLIVQHRRERDKRICDRIKAVLLFDKGWSIVAIAEALLLSEDAIREHVADYRESKKLKPENGGSTQKLSSEHSNRLAIALASNSSNNRSSVSLPKNILSSYNNQITKSRNIDLVI